VSRRPTAAELALPPPLERHYSASSAADLLDVTVGHLRNLRLQNKGPRWVSTADGGIRYPESALREYLEPRK
jgi:hypothetical protein